MSELEYVRSNLKAAQGKRQWQAIVLSTGLTRTTFYSIVKGQHVPNGATIEKLYKYFKSKK